MTTQQIQRVTDKAALRRLLKKGAHIMAEYDLSAIDIDMPEDERHWWMVQVPVVATAVPDTSRNVA